MNPNVCSTRMRDVESPRDGQTSGGMADAYRGGIDMSDTIESSGMRPYVYLVENKRLGIVKAGLSTSVTRSRILHWVSRRWQPLVVVETDDEMAARFAEQAILLHWFKRGHVIGADQMPHRDQIRSEMTEGFTEIVALNADMALDGVPNVLADLLGDYRPLHYMFSACPVDDWVMVWELPVGQFLPHDPGVQVGSVNLRTSIYSTRLHEHATEVVA